MFRSRYYCCAFILLLVLFITSCSRQKATVVAKVQVNKRSAEMGTPIEITYSFSTKQDFMALHKDQTVFVHFIDPKRVRRFQDDHRPPKPTTEWRPNGNYNWTRTVFIPKNIPAGEYTIVAGIYSPSKGDRMILEAKPHGNRAYEFGSILIEIPPQRPGMQYVSGWYEPESDPSDITSTWRWTKKEAVLKTRNPNDDALLYVKVDGVPERFPQGQKLTIQVNGQEIETFSMESNQPIMKKYSIDKAALGTDKTVEIKIIPDKTFTPASDKVSRDTRELGVRVYQVYLGKATD